MNKKLVLSERFKEHMKAHGNSFDGEYEKYLTEKVKNEILLQCNSDLNVVHVLVTEFPIVGFVTIVPVDKNDNIFWAKRNGRNIYSRFVKGKKPCMTNVITFVVKEQYNSKGTFNLISMYPSFGVSEKEVFDPNIDSIEELEKSINFWTEFAFVDTETEYIKETKKDIIEKNNVLFNSGMWYEVNYTENCPEAWEYYANLKCDKLDVKNLYYGSKIIKQYDGYGNFIQTQCEYTGLRFNYMCNGVEFKIGYSGNVKHDFVEEICLAG
ncbi:hypothetical protein [Clostridium sp. JS66]|uniref:hypothetical protein n=1 Tax=Clostridium sp. JS66 TaxID=3064705 RepID=UPI00298D8C3C|nr:hypothetical protein [Clostridium sp. JS66]WPC42924.1 hypothetical protein Q6H37_05485 [Clostridium sp. JS66]